MLPLQRIILFVGDPEVSAEFYRKLFGFKMLPTHSPAEWTELETRGCRLAFHKAHGGMKKSAGSSAPHKLVFGTKNVAGARKKLVARGAKMGPIKTFGDLVLCDGTDRDGYKFQLSNRP